MIISRPHRSTTYVNAAIVTYCYRDPSVCLSVTVVSRAKTAEPIEMPFGLRTRVGLRIKEPRIRLGYTLSLPIEYY